MAQAKYDIDKINQAAEDLFSRYRADWNFFVSDVFGVSLDPAQQQILHDIQHSRRVSVRSGTARGKDFVSACAAMCFLYLTPVWDSEGNLVENTKVALTAPTERQVSNIMMPEIARLYGRAKRRGKALPGKLNSESIRMEDKEWFLVGFKADNNNHEAWSGFHASHVMFVVTEATGISEDTFAAIEGNLQGDSRILIVFNPNTTIGYAAQSQKQDRWVNHRLSDLDAPNVVEKRIIRPGQVDFEWVKDHVDAWCDEIKPHEARESENDFQFDGRWYRPNDLFRIKVLGEFPKSGDDVLVPAKWIEIAQERWKDYHLDHGGDMIIGSDVAGMGRDNSVDCYRQGNYVARFEKHNSGGKADHMAVAGRHIHYLSANSNCVVSIDTIGEGAGVYSKEIEETNCENPPFTEEQVISCKFSESAEGLSDYTGEYKFANLKAYLYWAVRDWLNPDNKTGAMLPPGGTFMEEATAIKWSFQSSGKILMEPKEHTKERLGHSPDELDALANTFHPKAVEAVKFHDTSDELTDEEIEQMMLD